MENSADKTLRRSSSAISRNLALQNSHKAFSTQQQAQVKKPEKVEWVSPELAAQIVKHYILPMFDRKEAKGHVHREMVLSDQLN